MRYGEAALRITASRVGATRGVCGLNVQPVFRPARPGNNSGDVIFGSVGFDVTTSPGDFVLLGPGRYDGEGMTLNGLFFARAEPGPVARLYLIVCQRITD